MITSQDDHTPSTEVFARNVREFRERSGVTQLELSRRIGVKRAYVADVERARHAATLETVDKFAQGLGVKPWILVRPDGRRS